MSCRGLAPAMEDEMAKKLDAIEEAAAKAGMSVEDYLAQRKAAHRMHLRQIQKQEMEI